MEAANKGAETVSSSTSEGYQTTEAGSESLLAAFAPGLGATFIASFLALTVLTYSGLSLGLKAVDRFYH